MIVVIGFSDLEVSLFRKVGTDLKIDEAVRLVIPEDMTDADALIAEVRALGSKLPKVVAVNLDNPAWETLVTGLKRDPVWHYIPIMAFGFLEDADSVRRFYAAGGTSCIRKPHGYEGLMKIVGTAMRYWLDVSFLPNTFLDDCA